MEPQTHPDAFGEAFSHGIQRSVQVASAVVTGAQVLAHLARSRAAAQAERDQRARRALDAQVRADQAAARARLAGAGDPAWLRDADLVRAAQAWGAAMPYADPRAPWHEPVAVTVMRRAEERLRSLHPTAMARYDRLRSEGATPADAMLQAAPLFSYPPRARNPPYTPLAALPAAPSHGPAARPWQQDFPLPIGDVLAAATADQAPPQPAAPSPAVSPPPSPGRRS